MLGVSMAIPYEENVTDSRIYILTSSENVPPEHRKFFIFKTIQLLLSLCSLILFTSGLQRENEVLHLAMKYLALGGLTLYPVLCMLFRGYTKDNELAALVSNICAFILNFVIGIATLGNVITKYQSVPNKAMEMQMKASILMVLVGILYFMESLQSLANWTGIRLCSRTT